ncbi:hypothetical protein [Flavobacterium frigidarium]|uniref:PD-(D/E)XK nuclease superfamily protein n=1 Tax=Flavobacterium frigidarium TaxID=99286 RepID=A0ABV4KCK2_9FLAO
MENFEHKFREIYFYIGAFGITQKPLYPWDMETASEVDKLEFKIQVNKGFRIGQSLILEEILKLYYDKKQFKLEFRQARKVKDEIQKRLITNASKLVEHRIKILRHLVDFIAWQMLGHQYFKARRFHSGDKSRPDLLETNLESVIEVVNYFHRKDPINFALITDLTTFIDVGDLLVSSEKSLTIVECKSGSVQGQVDALINELGKDNWKVVVENLVKVKGKKRAGDMLKQASRTLNQMDKGTRITTFLNKEEGKDTFTNSQVNIYESKIPLQNYYEKLIESFTESIVSGYSLNVIENIVFYTVIRNVSANEGYKIFTGLLDGLEIRSQNIDYLHQLDIPIKAPLFVKPFSKEIMIELLTGRIKLFLAIDLDGLIQMFNERGIQARWMSRKETNKYLDSKPQYIPYMNNHQGILITINKHEIVLGSQFLTKILLDNITPSSFIDQYKSYHGEPIRKSSDE